MYNIIGVEADSKSLNWLYRETETKSFYPPAAACINGKYYQLNQFGVDSKEYLIAEAHTFPQALLLSINHYGADSVNIIELGNIVLISKQLECYADIAKILSETKFKGRQILEIAEFIAEQPDSIKKYFSEKSIPVKLLRLYTKLAPHLLAAVHEFVENNKPSTQSFKKAVTVLFDTKPSMDELLNIDFTSMENLKSKDISDFYENMQEVSKNFPLKIDTSDNFESGKLRLLTEGSTTDEIIKSAQKLIDAKEDIDRIIDFLKTNKMI